MEKELCLKFLVHLHKCASNVLRKQHIDEIDLTYINNEVDNFHRKLGEERGKGYDPAGALQAIQRIPEETVGDKVQFISKFMLRGKINWPFAHFGTKDEAHAQREAKVIEFREQVKKVLALVEYST